MQQNKLLFRQADSAHERVCAVFIFSHARRIYSDEVNCSCYYVNSPAH